MKFIFVWALANLPVALPFDPDYKDAITPPYMVYLKSDYLPCAGVLIHPLWVITAAHCNLPKLQLILGITKPSNLKEENYLQVVGYEKMIHHPQFSITSIEHNLMLIKLSDNIELNDYVKLASLPREPAAENTLCMVSTWAYHVCDIYKDPDSLQNVNISVISNTQCRAAYKTYNIRDTMLCVGIVPGRRQPCKEVTAAPAVCDGKLQGILTFADGCVLRADVGIYTRIINYMPWIENTIRNN
ncbi:probable inactive serine protease 58 [Phacochoerus africanus]|uniref:probable inactive serine protease 58 n=1 Tax=Phacochoerus africanus TaxID=41426 RepID=UPI001FD919E0|nr:probable inactive serine protease 58 [Phacochoerus africanus]